jgi:hypothetical protein
MRRKLKILIKRLVKDTLMRNGKFSPTLLTMFISFCWIFIYSTIYCIIHPFKPEIYYSMLGLAGGIKVTDAVSKLLTPKQNQP